MAFKRDSLRGTGKHRPAAHGRRHDEKDRAFYRRDAPDARNAAAAPAARRPLLSLTFDLPELDGGHYREAVEALKETLNDEQDSALGDSIAAQTQAYIEDKASSLGLSVRAEVQTALRDGVPFPDSVTLYGENSAALGAYIVQELGIAEENQLWIEPK